MPETKPKRGRGRPPNPPPQIPASFEELVAAVLPPERPKEVDKSKPSE